MGTGDSQKEAMSDFLQKHQALLCTLFLAICVLGSWPVAETGMHDDWSYIQTAQVFAKTGHVVFNGWGAPTLGVQLLPAALFIKFFGFSFTMARLTTILLGLELVALIQRTFVRCGIGEFNASVGAITLMTSPVCLPVVTSYLSDLWCLFAIVFCLYCCLRTLSAATENKAAAWICCAALGNAVLGTSRQIAWLGFLIIVPCTLLLCRRQRRVLGFGAAAFIGSCGIMKLTLAWFSKHPYTLPETLFVDLQRVRHTPAVFTRPLLELALLVLPVLLMFLPGLAVATRRGQGIAAIICLGFAVKIFVLYHHHTLREWNVPFIIQHGSLFSPRGVYYDWPIWGTRPEGLPTSVRTVVTFLTLSAIVSWFAVTFSRTSSLKSQSTSVPAFRAVLFLTLPFALGYAALLFPRASRNATVDRYLLPLVLMVLIVLLREYQERLQPRMPAASLVLAFAIAGWSVLTLQDAFSLYRAVDVAGKTLAVAGVPRSEFDGGWEYDAYTQVLNGGYVHQSLIRMPGDQQMLYGHRRASVCEIPIDIWIPDVQPKFALSYEPDGCGGRTSFAPILYKRLLSPHVIPLYLVKDPDFSGESGLRPNIEFEMRTIHK